MNNRDCWNVYRLLFCLKHLRKVLSALPTLGKKGSLQNSTKIFSESKDPDGVDYRKLKDLYEHGLQKGNLWS